MHQRLGTLVISISRVAAFGADGISTVFPPMLTVFPALSPRNSPSCNLVPFDFGFPLPISLLDELGQSRNYSKLRNCERFCFCDKENNEYMEHPIYRLHLGIYKGHT